MSDSPTCEACGDDLFEGVIDMHGIEVRVWACETCQVNRLFNAQDILAVQHARNALLDLGVILPGDDL